MRPQQPLKPQTTTLWYYPSQQIPGEGVQGNPRYTGRTPAYVVWNLLDRYTREEDLVVDPFCGGGTSIDVAKEMGRRGQGFDLAPDRDDIGRADARDLPLEDGVADFVFMDPPYSTHIEYSNDPRCIGKLDALEDEDYFAAMEAVFEECDRVLKNRRFMAVYVGDSYHKRGGFAGIGARLFGQLERRFRPIDHIAVVRGNRTLEKPAYHRAAYEGNFFLRGFQHLLIFKKERAEGGSTGTKKPRRG